MTDPNENIKRLHSNLVKKDGFNVPFDQFVKDMEDENKRKRLHSSLVKRDGFSVPYEQFSKDIVKKKDPTTSDPTESSSMGVSTDTQEASVGESTRDQAIEVIESPHEKFESLLESGLDYVRGFGDKIAAVPDTGLPGQAGLDIFKSAYNAIVNTIPSSYAKDELSSQAKQVKKLDTQIKAYNGKPDDTVISYRQPAGERGAERQPITLGDLKKQRAQAMKQTAQNISKINELDRMSQLIIPEQFDISDGISAKELSNLAGGQLPQIAQSVFLPVVGSYTQIHGEMYYDNIRAKAAEKFGVDQSEVTPNQIEAMIDAGEDDLGDSQEYALAAAGLDLIGLGGMGAAVRSAAKGVIKKSVLDGARTGGKAAVKTFLNKSVRALQTPLIEGSTEGGQNLLAQKSKAEALNEELDVDWSSALTEAAAGGIMGGFFGAGNFNTGLGSRQVEAMVDEGDLGAVRQFVEEGKINLDRVGDLTRDQIIFEEGQVKGFRSYTKQGDKITRKQAQEFIEKEDFEGLKIENDEQLEGRFQSAVRETESDTSGEQEAGAEPVEQSRTQPNEETAGESNDIQSELEEIRKGEIQDTADEFEQPAPEETQEGLTVDAEPELSAFDQTLRDEDPVVFEQKQNLITAVKEGKTSVETLKENSKYLTKTFLDELKDAGVTETGLGEARRLVSAVTKNKTITKDQRAKLSDLAQVVIKKDRIKKVRDFQSTIKSKLKTGKAGEQSGIFKKVIEIDPVKVSEKPYFDDYFNAVETVSKKMKRGKVYGDETKLIMDVHQQMVNQRSAEEVIQNVTPIAGKYKSPEELIQWMESNPKESGWVVPEEGGEDIIQNIENQKKVIRDNWERIQDEAQQFQEVTPKDIGVDPKIAIEVYKVAKEELPNFTSEGTDQIVEEGEVVEVLPGEIDRVGLEAKIRDRVPEMGEVNIDKLITKAKQLQRRDETISNLNELKDRKQEILESAATLEDKNYSRELGYLSSILNNDNWDQFEGYELNNMLRAVEQSEFFIPPDVREFARNIQSEQLARESIEDLTQANYVKDTYDNIIPKYEREIRNALKETQTIDPNTQTYIEGFSQRILKTRALNSIPYVGKQARGVLDEVMSRVAGLETNTRRAGNEINAKINTAFAKLKPRRGMDKADINNLAYMVMLDRHHKSDGFTGETVPLGVIIDQKRPKSDRYNTYLVKLYDQFVKNGEFNSEAALEALGESGRNLIKTLKEVAGQTSVMNFHNSKYGEKGEVRQFEYYVPYLFEKDMNVLPQLGEMLPKKAVSKAKTSRQRKKYRNEDGTFDTRNLENMSFSALDAFRRAAMDQIRGYYLQEDVADIVATLTKAQNLGDKQTEAVFKSISVGVQERLQGQLNQLYTDDKIVQTLRTLEGNAKRALISSASRRLIAEPVSNAMLWMTHPTLFKTPEIGFKELVKVMEDVGSVQTERVKRRLDLYGRKSTEGTAGEYTAEIDDINQYQSTWESQLKTPEQKRLAKGFYALMEKLNKVSQTIAVKPSTALIAIPDAFVISRPAANAFTNRFQEITGEKFDAQKYLTDKTYKAQVRGDVKKAMSYSDKLSTGRQAGSRFFNLPGTYSGDKGSILLKMANEFFTSFASTQSGQNINALQSLFNLQRLNILNPGQRNYHKMGSGSMSKSEAMGVLASNAANIAVYQFLGNVLLSQGVDYLLSQIFDYEEEPIEDKMKRATRYGIVEYALSLTGLGKKGAIVYGLSSLAIDAGIRAINSDKDIVDEIDKTLSYTPSMLRAFGGLGFILGTTFRTGKAAYDWGRGEDVDEVELSKDAATMMGLPVIVPILGKVQRGLDEEEKPKKKKPRL